MIFDIVIPLGPNELYIFNENIQTIKLNVIGYRNIYVIAVAKPLFENYFSSKLT